MFALSSPKYFSQLRNIFLPSLFSPKQILTSTKRWRHSSCCILPPLGNSVSLICPLNSLNKSSISVQKSLLDQLETKRNVCSQETFTFYPCPHSLLLPLQLQLCCTCSHCYEEMREHCLITKAAEKDAFISLSAILVPEFTYCSSKHRNLQTYFQLGSVAAKEGSIPIKS